jgi:hypothetical protein
MAEWYFWGDLRLGVGGPAPQLSTFRPHRMRGYSTLPFQAV